MRGTESKLTWLGSLCSWAAAAAVLLAIAAIGFLAPTETSMGQAQRILYIHVAVAWLSMAGFIVMSAAGAMYLWRRELAWDHWAGAAAELGWLACSLTLATGSLWAHAAWNTWWTWDPRLTTSFVLWAMYCAILLLRSDQDDAHRSARLGAILAIVGMLDVPLVAMATRWFRGVHPTSPGMEPAMRLTLWIAMLGFTALFALLLVLRQRQLRLESAVDSLETFTDP